MFARYLSGREADDYVVRKYVELHPAAEQAAGSRHAIDDVLVRFAARGPVRARVADAYARIFRPHGLLRCKLVLAFAVLENSPGFHRPFTGGSGGSLVGGALRFVAAGTVFVLTLVVGVLLFLPARFAGKRT